MQKNFRIFSILFLLTALQFSIYAMEPKGKGKATPEQEAAWEADEAHARELQNKQTIEQIEFDAALAKELSQADSKPVGPLIILQSAEIKAFLKSIGCDIEELWDCCMDTIYQTQKISILEEKKFPSQFITKLQKIAEYIKQAFDQYNQKIKDSEYLIDPANLILFLRAHEIKNSTIGSLNIEMSTATTLLNSGDAEYEEIYVKHRTVENILWAIRDSILSYFDATSLSSRLEQGDNVIFDIPETPIFIQDYSDNIIRVNGLSAVRQDSIFTEVEQHIQDYSTTTKQKILSFLLCLSELAAIGTMPSYQATIAIMKMRDQQKSWATDLQKIDIPSFLPDEKAQAYRILGLQPGSGHKAIREAYKQLSIRFHPDRNPDGEAMFVKISQAYEYLSK